MVKILPRRYATVLTFMASLSRCIAPILFGITLAGVALPTKQASAKDSISAADKQRAGKKFRAGEAAFKKAEYGDAARAFEEAYQIAPHPSALLNAARSYEKNGELVRGATLCAAYLREADPEDPKRKDARALLAAIRPKVGRVEISAPDADSIDIDGDEVAADGTIYVDPGDHVAVARFESGRARRKFSVVAGSVARLVIDPPKRSGPAEPETDETVETDTDEEDDSEAKPLSPAWFFVGLSATAVLGGIGAWSGVDTNNARDEYELNPTADGLDEGRSKQMRTNILLGATGVVGLTTLVIGLFATDWGSSDDPVEDSEARADRFRLGLSFDRITVSGTF